MVARVLIIVVSVAVLFLQNVVAKELEKVEPSIKIVEDISIFKSLNPDVKILPLTLNPTGRTARTYSFGKRFLGDRLVAQYGNTLNYPSMQNVKIENRYPADAFYGATISYVEVHVNSNSDLNNVYLISGGIGDRRTYVTIEVKNTLFLQYSTFIFGY